MTCLRMSARSSSFETVSECWVEMTTASIRTGLPSSLYSTRDLALAVRTKVRHFAALADFAQLLAELVGQRDGSRHQLFRLVGGIAEHHALIAAPPVSTPMAMSPDCLLMEEITGAGVRIEAIEGVVVSDGGNDAAHEGLEIDISLGGDFSGDDDEAGGGECFAGDAAIGVLFEAGVEDGVGNLVGNFVGMPFSHLTPR